MGSVAVRLGFKFPKVRGGCERNFVELVSTFDISQASWRSYARFVEDPAKLASALTAPSKALCIRSAADVADILDGGEECVRGLVLHISPFVQAEVAMMMTRYGNLRGRNGRQEVQDLVQDVFVILFKDNGKTLRAWRADGGRKFGSFVRLVAKRRLLSVMRTRTKNPWPDEPTDNETLDRSVRASEVDSAVGFREELEILWEKLSRWFGDEDHRLFRLFFVEGLSIDEVETMTGKNRQALYSWRRELRKFARSVRDGKAIA